MYSSTTKVFTLCPLTEALQNIPVMFKQQI